MYFFYIDESGHRDPNVDPGVRPDGTRFDRDWLFVTVAVSLFEGRWRGFENTINEHKIFLLERVNRSCGLRLDLSDAEIKSNWVRIPKERNARPFLANLTDEELSGLLELFYEQINYHKMHLFASIIDKRYLREYMDYEKLSRKAYELTLERIESFLSNWHSKHKGLIVPDNIGKRSNESLALKHSHFQRNGTSSGVQLRHIVELPMFVESSLSNGGQLADLCSYSVYRAFRDGNLKYRYFDPLVSAFYTSHLTPAKKIDGLKVFPDDSPLVDLLKDLEKERS